MVNKNAVALEKINKRRRQLHVHSVLYYHMDTTLIDDATFDMWALDLVQLHKTYPNLVMTGYEPRLFADWTGDTGMHLPATDWAVGVAMRLIRHKG